MGGGIQSALGIVFSHYRHFARKTRLTDHTEDRYSSLTAIPMSATALTHDTHSAAQAGVSIAAPHQSVLDKVIVLSLNSAWQPIGQTTPKKAIVAMMSESNGEPPVLALDIEMDSDGSILYANPTAWPEWAQLPVREGDLYVQTKSGPVRCPTVTVAVNFSKVPMKRPRLSTGAIWTRDGGVCQYTGEKVTRVSGNIDHIRPRDRGGLDTWENMVVARRDLNTLKSNRLNSEIGLKLLRQPKAPPSVPVSVTLTEVRHPSWTPFLIA